MLVNFTIVYDIFDNKFLKINDELLIPINEEDFDKFISYLRKKKVAKELAERYGYKL